MTYCQYINVHHDLAPDEFMDEYNMHIEPIGYVYFEIRRVM